MLVIGGRARASDVARMSEREEVHVQSTVFYSWQSDSDSRVNRSFIEAALKAAVAKLNRDVVVQEALRENSLSVDKDTKGLPGMPPIADSIFAKIDKCLVFVPDMTFVGAGNGDRRISNPNVLIEYGWALCSRSHARIVAVMNAEYGEPTGENLPFDMRHMRRPITYRLSPEDDESKRREVKAELVNNLYDALALVAKLPGDQEDVSASDGGTLAVGSPSLFFPIAEPLTTMYGDSGTARELRMHESARMYLRVIPTRESREPLTSRVAQQLMQGGRLLPLGRDGGSSFERNAFGAFVFARDGDRILKLTQLFKSRELWGIDAELLDESRIREFSGATHAYVPCVAFEHSYVKALHNYLEFARDALNIEPPVRVICGVTGISNYRMTAPTNMHFGAGDRFGGRFVESEVAHSTRIDTFDVEVLNVLRPYFDRVWDECGVQRPDVGVLN